MLGCSAFSDLENTAELGVNRTAYILDEAITSIDNNSADWQKVLQDTSEKLTSETQSTIRNEVSDLLHRGVAATSAEVRCDGDFVANRVRLGLLRIKSALVGTPVPPPEPALCSVVPLAVDRALVSKGRLNRLELYGYDLDSGDLQVLLEDGGRLVDVTHVLNRPTHYHLTLTLGGSTGVPLTASSQRLLIKWAGHELSSLSVIQPETPVCQTEVVTYHPAALHFIPARVTNAGNTGKADARGQGARHGAQLLGLPLLGGKDSDADFDGHGPQVDARVRLINEGNAVSAELFMSAKEVKGDGTWAQGTRTQQLYVPAPGWRVTDILVPSVVGDACPPYATCFSYTDTNEQNDLFAAGSGPVQRFEFIGDTDGEEAGTRTSMMVTFNPLRFELTEEGHCVTGSTLSLLRSQGLLAPETLDSLAPALR